MKTRITRLTLTKDSTDESGSFDIEVVEEDGGECILVTWGIDGASIPINPDEWPFLRDAIDRMFEEITENESEGKLKKLFETPAPWDTSGASGEEPHDHPSNVLAAVEEESGWVPWNGGECPIDNLAKVHVRLRDGYENTGALFAGEWAWEWDSLYPDGDIIAYKVVD